MIKLKKILNEILNTYSVECSIWSDRKFPITDILNQIRALKKITIVGNITPEDYLQKEDIEYTKLKIKFVTREEADTMLQNILNGALAQNDEDKVRIQGIRSMKIRKGTLNKL